MRGLELIAPALELLDAIQLLFPLVDFVMSSVFFFFSFEACQNCFDNQFFFTRNKDQPVPGIVYQFTEKRLSEGGFCDDV